MKEKIKPFVYSTLALFIIISVFLIICMMLAGPFMIGWNWSFGLIAGPVTYIKCLKLLIGSVLTIGFISATLNIVSNGRKRNG